MVALSLVFCFDWIKAKGLDDYKVFKIITIALIVVLNALVAYSRLYTGAHGIGQVCLGLIIGIWTGLYIEMNIREPLTQMIEAMFTLKVQLIETVFAFLALQALTFTIGLIFEIIILNTETPLAW